MNTGDSVFVHFGEGPGYREVLPGTVKQVAPSYDPYRFLVSIPLPPSGKVVEQWFSRLELTTRE